MDSPTPEIDYSHECEHVEPVHHDDGSVDWEQTKAKLQTVYSEAPPDESTGAPIWQLAYNQLWEQEREREIVDRMQTIDGKSVPGLSTVDWVSGYRGSPGFIVDEQEALSTSCTRIDLGNGHTLVYSKGIIGALDEDQKSRYCPNYIDKQASPREIHRLQIMAESAHSCSIQTKGTPPENHLEVYFTCLGKELKQRGEKP